MLLSILVPTVPRRLRTCFPDLIEKLSAQADQFGNQVEVLGFYDNKRRTVGSKRNELLRAAHGRFLVFIDDDDDVTDDFVQLLFGAASAHPDAHVIVYDCITTINNDPNQTTYSTYSVKNPKPFHQWREHWEYGDIVGEIQWRGQPAHTMCWRSEIAKKYLFSNINFGEDMDWIERVYRNEDIVHKAGRRKEVRINKVLYFYKFNSQISETRG